MYARHVLLHCGALAFLALPAVACNSILNISDIELGCYLDRTYMNVTSNASTALVRFTDDGVTGPELIFELEPDLRLTIKLYEGFAMHPILYATGHYEINAQDSGGYCGICVAIRERDNATGRYAIRYQAHQGSLDLTTFDNVQLTGRLRNLELRHVRAAIPGHDTTIVKLNDDCAVTIHEVEFDKPYSMNTAHQL